MPRRPPGMSSLFVECIVAPGFAPDAMEILTAKKNLRLMTFPVSPRPCPSSPSDGWWAGADEALKGAPASSPPTAGFPTGRVLRSVYGGMLAQTPPMPPFYGVDDDAWKVVTERAPTAQEMDDLRFAWAAVFGVKSNAILLAAGGATLGIGAGQMSRVDSSRSRCGRPATPSWT